MSSAVNIFVHAIRKHSKKCLEQKVVRFGSPEWIPMFQPHWIALELVYNMRLEPSFSIERFPSYTLTKIDKNRHFNARFITTLY